MLSEKVLGGLDTIKYFVYIHLDWIRGRVSSFELARPELISTIVGVDRFKSFTVPCLLFVCTLRAPLLRLCNLYKALLRRKGA